MEGRHQRPVDPVGEADPALLEGPLAGHEPELHAEELVEDQPAGGPVVVGLGLGPVDAVVGPGAVGEVEAAEDLRGDRVVELPGPPQGLVDELLELPGGDVGLARLRIDRNDHARLLADAAEHVDGRVRHLVLAPVVLELAEEGRLGADGELLRPPRLVEERDVEVRGAVVDDRLDQAPALAGAPGAHLADLGVDRGLLPHPEVGDVGLLGAVEVAAGVVLDQLQDVGDAEHPQPLLEARRDAGEAGDRNVPQLAQRLAHCRASVSALLS